MRSAARLLEVVLASLVVWASGCAAPSVAPLLRVAAEAMRQEQDRLTIDLDRDRLAMESRRAALRDGYAADLREKGDPVLDAEWVMEATDVYVAAREALVHHEWALAEERRRRRDNLDAAIEAQERALRLIERQDELLRHVTNPRLLERITP